MPITPEGFETPDRKIRLGKQISAEVTVADIGRFYIVSATVIETTTTETETIESPTDLVVISKGVLAKLLIQNFAVLLLDSADLKDINDLQLNGFLDASDGLAIKYPRLTTAQRDALSANWTEAEAGAEIFNIDSQQWEGWIWDAELGKGKWVIKG